MTCGQSKRLVFSFAPFVENSFSSIRNLYPANLLVIVARDPFLSIFEFRCWNQTQFGPLATWAPTEEQIEAARNQNIFYAKVWEEDFEYWLTYYLEHPSDNGSSIHDFSGPIVSLDEAYLKALNRATGSSQCFLNRAGSTWFFFTIMTTIGTFLDSQIESMVQNDDHHFGFIASYTPS
jgi:hypothetical protein